MQSNPKDILRKTMLQKRKSMKSQEVTQCSEKIMETLLNMESFKKSKSIMLYLSFKNEVDTYNIVQWCLNHDKKVIVPFCIKKESKILPCEIKNLDTSLTKSTLGIMEPKVESLNVVEIEDINIIIVPGVVFDKNLNRIGFGAGYYDRFLSRRNSNIPAVGICYDYQLVDEVPTDKYDIPLDYIITEKRILKNNTRENC